MDFLKSTGEEKLTVSAGVTVEADFVATSWWLQSFARKFSAKPAAADTEQFVQDIAQFTAARGSWEKVKVSTLCLFKDEDVAIKIPQCIEIVDALSSSARSRLTCLAQEFLWNLCLLVGNRNAGPTTFYESDSEIDARPPTESKQGSLPKSTF